MDVQNLLIKYQVEDISRLAYLMQKYLSKEPEKPVDPVKSVIKPPPDCLQPDERYADELLRKLETLKPVLQKRFYTDLEKVLKGCAEDFSDCEESMAAIHGCMKEDLYKSLQRLKKSDIPILKAFLLQAGYREICVRVGDPFKGNENAWEQAFSDNTDDPDRIGRIKEIHRQPYQITFWCDDEEKTYILGGQCTYYKKEMK